MNTRMLDNSVSGVKLGGLAARDRGGLKGFLQVIDEQDTKEVHQQSTYRGRMLDVCFYRWRGLVK